MHDLRFALRTLGRAPGFTAIAVISIALGIGANTAIFSLIDQVVLRPLPVADPSNLVFLKVPGHFPGASTSDIGASVFSYPMYKDLRDRSREALVDVVGRASASVSLQHTGAAEPGRAELVTGNLFEMLGIKPLHGRLLTPDDDRSPGAHPVVVLSHSYWTRRFGASPSVVNQTLRVNGHPMTIIGVTPPRFVGVITSQVPEIFVPVMMKKQITPNADTLLDRQTAWLNVFGRLQPGAGPARAEAILQPVFRSLLEDYLKFVNSPRGRNYDQMVAWKLTAEPASTGLSNMRRQWTTPLKALFLMVGLVLLIACANVANLMITRAAGRSREIAIRLSVGAKRTRIVRQLLVESLLLAIAGGALGLVIAYWAVDALLRLLPMGSGPSVVTFHLDQRVQLFTLLLCVITAIIFGSIPSWQSSRADLMTLLRAQQGSIASGLANARIRRVMVIGQVALALVLLVGAVLFGRSLGRLLQVDPGFRHENLLTFTIDPRLSGYDPVRTQRFYRDMETRLAEVPNVTAVAAAMPGPFSNSGRGSNITLEGYRTAEGEDTSVGVRSVSAGYFKAMGIPLIAGREITERDLAGAPKVMLVNEEFARHFTKGTNPIGRRVAFGAGSVKPDIEIVGLVRNNLHSGLKEKVAKAVFLPYMQEDNLSAMNVYVRASRDESALAAAVRDAVSSLDRNIPLYNLSTMRVEVEESIYTEKLLAAVSAAFGLLATLLAAIGVYGVIAYNVARRTSEIGVRVALGALRGDVLRLVMKEIVLLSAAGVVVGGFAAYALGRWVESELFGIRASDPIAFVIAIVAILAAALLAAWIPARRAARIDPVQALRYE